MSTLRCATMMPDLESTIFHTHKRIRRSTNLPRQLPWRRCSSISTTLQEFLCRPCSPLSQYPPLDTNSPVSTSPPTSSGGCIRQLVLWYMPLNFGYSEVCSDTTLSLLGTCSRPGSCRLYAPPGARLLAVALGTVCSHLGPPLGTARDNDEEGEICHTLLLAFNPSPDILSRWLYAAGMPPARACTT